MRVLPCSCCSPWCAILARREDAVARVRRNHELAAALLTGKVAIGGAYKGMSESCHRSCKCGAVYDRCEQSVESREISRFECAVCGKTIESWNSAWVPRYRFIACPVRMTTFRLGLLPQVGALV